MAPATASNAKFSRTLALIMSVGCVAYLSVLYNDEINGHLFKFQFNPYAIFSAVAVAAIICGLVMLSRRQARTDERVWLGLYMGSALLFGVGEMVSRLCIYPDAALFWTMLSGLGSAFIVSFMLLFTFAYTNPNGGRYVGTITSLLSLSMVILYFYSFTNVIWDLHVDHLHLYPWGYYNDSGAGLLPVALWLNVLYGISAGLLIRFRRHTTNSILRKQALLFVYAIAVPGIIGVVNDGVLPAFGITTLPIALTAATLTGVLIVYGVLRYQILTISPALFSESILSLMHESVIVVDSDFTIIYTNTEANSILSIDGEGAKRHFKEFLHVKTDNSLLMEAIEKTAHDSAVTVPHIDIVNHLGHKIPVRVTLSRLHGEASAAYVLVLTDIKAELDSKAIIERTVRTRTRELHEARAYLLSSINSLGQGFVLVDRVGSIVHNNMAAARALSHNDVNLDGTTTIMAATSHMKWDVNLGQAVEAVLAGHGVRVLHAAVEDGMFYDIFITPVMADQAVIGAAIVLEDTTERKILDRSRDEFFSIASHELRTPLTAIRGNMEILRQYYPELMKDKAVAESITDTHEASVRLIGIVNDFLDSSRLEQGKLTYNLTSVAIVPLMATIQRSLAPLLQETKNTLTVEKLDDIPPIYADNARLQQILLNIIGNAVKYNTGAHITVAAQVKARSVQIVVTDTGKGISPENQNLLFHKFQQATDSILTRANTQGTGLGLYISRLLAKQMGGDVELLHSELDQGSSFAVTMPLATASQMKSAPKK